MWKIELGNQRFPVHPSIPICNITNFPYLLTLLAYHNHLSYLINMDNKEISHFDLLPYTFHVHIRSFVELTFYKTVPFHPLNLPQYHLLALKFL